MRLKELRQKTEKWELKRSLLKKKILILQRNAEKIGKEVYFGLKNPSKNTITAISADTYFATE